MDRFCSFSWAVVAAHPSAVRYCLRLLIVVSGCLHLCGGDYSVVQVIAWGQMLVDYTAEQGLVRGTISTFDGDHPCDLCNSIKAAKKQNPSGNDQVPPLRDRTLNELPKYHSSGSFCVPLPSKTDVCINRFPSLGIIKSRTLDGPDTPPPKPV